MLVTLLVFSLAAPAGGVKVKAKAYPKATLAEYKTFSWYPVRVLTRQGVIESDDHWIPLIKGAIRAQLLAKGLAERETGGDMLVAAYGLREPNAQLEAVLYPGGVNWGLGSPTATMGRYNNGGTLAVSLTNAKTNEGLWVGVATSELKDDYSDADEKVRKAAQKMFSKYPALR